jgi:hypothetical protein
MAAKFEPFASGQHSLPVRLWQENPNGLVSLLDMVRYHVRDLHALLVWLSSTSNYTLAQERHRRGEAALLTEREKSGPVAQLVCVKKHFYSLELTDSIPAIDALQEHLKGPIYLGEFRGQLLAIRRILTDCLESRYFMYVPRRRARFAPKFLQPTGQLMSLGKPSSQINFPSEGDQWVKPFGPEVFDAFESARFDAEEVAKCLVADATTAAVFHMMRVVEWGVRTLGEELGLRRIKETTHANSSRKTAAPRIKYTPIQNLPWEKLHDQLRAKVNRKLVGLRPGPTKDKKSGFYGSVLHDFHGFKDAWRNHVMHTRGNYDDRDAMQVFSHVKRFMEALAKHRMEKQTSPPESE